MGGAMRLGAVIVPNYLDDLVGRNADVDCGELAKVMVADQQHALAPFRQFAHGSKPARPLRVGRVRKSGLPSAHPIRLVPCRGYEGVWTPRWKGVGNRPRPHQKHALTR